MDNLAARPEEKTESNPPDAAMPCRRCGVCCRRHQAFVSPADIARITAYLGITPDDWERLYDDPRWRYTEYRLIRHIDGACAFLRDEGGLAACAIHPVKPGCCVSWQPDPSRQECREGMEISDGF
jgi:Fe-S-cluster containining protein